MKKRIVLIFALVMSLVVFTGCESEISGRQEDTNKTLQTASRLQINQPTPNDIEYSLERYNLIRRAYWVNGMRERANTLPCEIEKPLGYIVLFSGNATVGAFVVDGKVSSLNSFLTPDSEFFEKDMAYRSASTPTSKSCQLRRALECVPMMGGVKRNAGAEDCPYKGVRVEVENDENA